MPPPSGTTAAHACVLMTNHAERVTAQLLNCAGVVLLLLAGCAANDQNSHADRKKPTRVESAPTTRTERPDKAESTARRAEAHARYAAGVVRDLRGEDELATEEYWLSARNDLTNEPLIIEVAQRLLQRNQSAKAIALLEPAAAMPSASGLVDAWLGMALKQAGRTDPAAAAFRRAIRKAPQLLIAHHGLAQLHLDQKQPQQALKVLDNAAQTPSVNPAFLVDIAGLLAVATRTKSIDPEQAKSRALRLLERAALANPSEPIVLQKMADTYKLIGELGRAANLYLDLLQKRPPDNRVLRRILREQLVRLYVAADERTKAAEQLNEILKEDGANPQVYYLLGAIAAEEKQYARAADYYEKTILLKEDFEPAYHDLAGVRLSQGEPQAALEILGRARARFERSFLVEFYTGLAQAALKQYPEALKSFTDAELLARISEPARLTHLFYAEVALVHAGLADQATANNRDDDAKRHYDEAENLLRQSLAMAPDNADVLLRVGSIYERMASRANTAKRTDLAARFYAEADKHLQRCVELVPTNSEALNYLGYMWADRGVRLDEARALVERALKAEPDNAAYLDSLAWALFKLGQPDAALKPMLEAVAKSEKPDATLLDHLGDIYYALKQYKEARDAWSQSLQVEDDPEVRRKLEAAPVPESH